jgi:hypothetical protein
VHETFIPSLQIFETPQVIFYNLSYVFFYELYCASGDERSLRGALYWADYQRLSCCLYAPFCHTMRELRVACQTLFEAWHPDEHQSEIAFVENGVQLFEAGHLKAIGLIDGDEKSRWPVYVLTEIYTSRNALNCHEFSFNGARIQASSSLAFHLTTRYNLPEPQKGSYMRRSGDHCLTNFSAYSPHRLIRKIRLYPLLAILSAIDLVCIPIGYYARAVSPTPVPSRRKRAVARVRQFLYDPLFASFPSPWIGSMTRPET